MINDEKIEEPEVNEINEEEKEEIDENIIMDNDKRFLKFYEKIRKKFKKRVKGSIGRPGEKLSDYLFLLPDIFVLLLRLSINGRVKASLKVFIGAILAYLLLPVDIIPDFIPFIGYVDDLVLAVYGLDLIFNRIDNEVLYDNWSGDEDLLHVIQVIIGKAEHLLDRGVLKKIKNWINKNA